MFATNDPWRLEARSDGSSPFSHAASGAYGFGGSGVDATVDASPRRVLHEEA